MVGWIQRLSEWSCVNVAEWMAALNLYQYAHVFQRQGVDGPQLLKLSQDQLQVAPVTAASTGPPR